MPAIAVLPLVGGDHFFLGEAPELAGRQVNFHVARPGIPHHRLQSIDARIRTFAEDFIDQAAVGIAGLLGPGRAVGNGEPLQGPADEPRHQPVEGGAVKAALPPKDQPVNDALEDIAGK